MEFKKGDRVRHPIKNDWGIGQVLSDSNRKEIKVFFAEGGTKTLLLTHTNLIKVSGEEAVSLVLDNLAAGKLTPDREYHGIKKLIAKFLKMYPNGFHDQKYIEDERIYKDKAFNLLHKLLHNEDLCSLLEDKNYQEITKRALKVVYATNLIFTNEKMSLKDGLVRTESQKLFAIALYNMLFGDGELRPRFEAFSKMLEDIGAPKWTVASYFLFIMWPDKNVFIKPMVTQDAAKTCGYEINYKPQLNWLTYHSVSEFYKYIFSEISELKPRDMIDIQSFLWCIAQ